MCSLLVHMHAAIDTCPLASARRARSTMWAMAFEHSAYEYFLIFCGNMHDPRTHRHRHITITHTVTLHWPLCGWLDGWSHRSQQRFKYLLAFFIFFGVFTTFVLQHDKHTDIHRTAPGETSRIVYEYKSSDDDKKKQRVRGERACVRHSVVEKRIIRNI